MLHAYGGKDTYSSDQNSSIMYGYSSGTAMGVTSDANSFLNDKYWLSTNERGDSIDWILLT